MINRCQKCGRIPGRSRRYARHVCPERRCGVPVTPYPNAAPDFIRPCLQVPTRGSICWLHRRQLFAILARDPGVAPKATLRKLVRAMLENTKGPEGPSGA